MGTATKLAASEGPAVEAVEQAQAAAVDGADQKELFVRARREKLPNERSSVTHSFSVGGQKGYIIVGMYKDGRPGEVFIKMAKEGSTLSGVMDGLALSLSIGLQYGVPLRALADKLINTRFEPSGITPNPEIRFASSLLDYIARWLGGKFISADYLKHGTETNANAGAASVGASPKSSAIHTAKPQVSGGDAPSCPNCGMLMVSKGSCCRCTNCGTTSGCS